MKHKFNLLFGAVIFTAVLLFSSSCHKEKNPSDQLTGNLSLGVNLSALEMDINNTLKSTSSEDLRVEIFVSGDTDPHMIFDCTSDIPESLELPIGEYIATAFSAENPAAAFESPYYFGESDPFIITAGETSLVEINCALASIMTSVVYSDQVITSFSDYHTTVRNPSGELTFSKTEVRNGFFNSGPLIIEAVLTYIDSDGNTQTKTLNGEIPDAQVGKHYEIQVDASLPGGSSSISVQLNKDVVKEIIILNDDNTSGEPGDTNNDAGISFGDLLITEIMYNPDALNDSEGEWFEIYNNTSTGINLKDLVIRRGSNNDLHQITSDVEIAAGEYAVMGRTETATNNVDYVYGTSIDLTNSGYELFINTYGTNGTDGTVICSVDYGASGFKTSLTGKSIQLDPSVKDVTEAQTGSNWCASTQQYSTGDLGTPGLANTSCE